MNTRNQLKNINPYKAGSSKILGKKNVIKLSSNESPFGPSLRVLKVIQQISNTTNRYPESESLSLKNSISKRYKLNKKNIFCANGSDEILGLICQLYLTKGDEVIIPKNSFLMYEIYSKIHNAKIIKSKTSNFEVDTNNILSNINKKTKIIFVANPNNPTGTFLSPKEIESFLDNLDRNIIVLLDQAYFDYSSYNNEDISFDLIKNYPNVIISRSFSKAYGLAGFRIGYSVSSPEVADYLNRVRQPFNANSLALVAAEVALSDENHLKKSLEINLDQKTILMKGLRNLGYECIPSEGNFISFNSNGNGQKLFEDLLNVGVIVRTLGVYKMPNYLRTTIGLPEENLIFLEKLSSLS